MLDMLQCEVCVPVGIGSDVVDELAVDHARGIEAEAHLNAQRALKIAVDGLGHTHHLPPPATKRKVRGGNSSRLVR